MGKDSKIECRNEAPEEAQWGPKMIIHNVTQRSPEWFKVRAGIPTASEFDRIMTPTFEPRTGDGVKTYVAEKLSEKILGHPIHSFGGSGEMEQGNILEDEAIPFYEFRFNTEITRVGFCTTDDGKCGCSPDGMLMNIKFPDPDKNGPFTDFHLHRPLASFHSGIEIKCPQIVKHVQYLLAGTLPKEYAAQVHGSMYVTGAPRWTFMSYNRKLDPLVLTIERDPLIMAKIDAALKGFYELSDAQYAILKDRVAKKETREAPLTQPVSLWPRA